MIYNSAMSTVIQQDQSFIQYIPFSRLYNTMYNDQASWLYNAIYNGLDCLTILLYNAMYNTQIYLVRWLYNTIYNSAVNTVIQQDQSVIQYIAYTI